MQRACNGLATGLQWACSGLATGLQRACSGFATGLQRVCSRLATGLQQACNWLAAGLQRAGTQLALAASQGASGTARPYALTADSEPLRVQGHQLFKFKSRSQAQPQLRPGVRVRVTGSTGSQAATPLGDWCGSESLHTGRPGSCPPRLYLVCICVYHPTRSHVLVTVGMCRYV